jgi:hypothetical protein
LHLENICFNYLLCHELPHILHGHIDYMADRLGIPFVSEFAWQRGTPEPPLTRQTMEMDADSGAVAIAGDNIHRKVTDPSRKPDPPWDRYYADAPGAFSHWSFAIWAFLRVFGDDSLAGVADATQLTYPPWRLRQQIALNTQVAFVRQHWDANLIPTCSGVMTTAAVQAELAFERVTGSPREVSGLQHTWSGEGWKHFKDVLRAHWQNELRSELVPFAFTDDLPK